MVALLRFSTILLVMVIMPEISPDKINIGDFLPFLPDATEHFDPLSSILGEVEKDVRADLGTVLKGANQVEKRNGDLINFLLGLPRDMLDAGKK